MPSHGALCTSDVERPQPKIAYVIAVIAKCPIAGQSKTRLQPLFESINNTTSIPRDDGAAILAQAMLCDVLVSISHCCRQARRDNETNHSPSSDDSNTTSTSPNIRIDQLLFYAPPTDEGYQMMQQIVDTCSHYCDGDSNNSSIKDDWTLLPIDNTKPNTTDIDVSPETVYESHSNNLSNILSNVVRTGQTRYDSSLNIPTTVILFGMDAPEIPMNELYRILTTITPTATAFLCPAYDGGYAMLSIPPLIKNHHSSVMRDSIFQSVSPYWSHPLTAVTQIKALSDVGISTVIGPMVHDIDTPDDVLTLQQRLKSKRHIPMDTKPNTTVVTNDNDETKDETKDETIVGCCLYRPSVLLRDMPTHIFDDYIPCQHTRQALIDLQLF